MLPETDVYIRYQRALEKAWLDPFSNETGIEVYRDTEPEIAKIRAMVDTGNVQWDLVTGGGETLMRGIEYGLFSGISEDMVNQYSLYLLEILYGIPINSLCICYWLLKEKIHK